MARIGMAPSPAHAQRVRIDQLVRVIEVNCEKLADPDLDLPLDPVDRLQAALKRAYDSNILRLLVAGASRGRSGTPTVRSASHAPYAATAW